MSNTKLSKTNILRKGILSKIESHISNDILLNDIEKFINELNRRKITTLNKNLESFLGYIDDILSEVDNEANVETHNNDLSNNYISKDEQKTSNFDGINNTESFGKDFINIKDEIFINKINKVRGFFWLTVTEFTQGRNSTLVLKYRKIVEKGQVASEK